MNLPPHLSFRLLGLLFVALILFNGCFGSEERVGDLPGYLPPKDTNNLWYDKTDSQTAIVFVHGILSDSRSCWYNKEAKTYWPEMIRVDEEHFHKPSIYLAGYYTEIDSGPYEIRNAADEILAGLRRRSPSHPAVLDKSNIIFVCHSTGGIVTRYLLESKFPLFAEKNIGLVLVASPSYGSRQADRLSWLEEFYENELGKQLKWGNWSLRDLDARFKNLLYERRIPNIAGVEAYENHFIIHRKWLRDTNFVVTEESAGRYFGAPKLLRNTDHFSTVKPDSESHPGYELLADFLQQDFNRLIERVEKEHGQSRVEGLESPATARTPIPMAVNDPCPDGTLTLSGEGQGPFAFARTIEGRYGRSQNFLRICVSTAAVRLRADLPGYNGARILKFLRAAVACPLDNGSNWEVARYSQTRNIERSVTPGETIVLEDLDFVIPIASIPDIHRCWVLFEAEEEVDNVVGRSYAHSDRDFFRQ